MRYIKKFEANKIILSADRVSEIKETLSGMSSDFDKGLITATSFYKELSTYTSKSKYSNNQIDDAYVDIGALISKFKDILDTINNITDKLEDYTEKGPNVLY